jgi:hypothetical protein
LGGGELAVGGLLGGWPKLDERQTVKVYRIAPVGPCGCELKSRVRRC